MQKRMSEPPHGAAELDGVIENLVVLERPAERDNHVLAGDARRQLPVELDPGRLGPEGGKMAGKMSNQHHIGQF